MLLFVTSSFTTLDRRGSEMSDNLPKTSLDIDWAQYAKRYDALLQLKPYINLMSEICELVSQSQAAHALDVGCGTGNVIEVLLKHHQHVTALDKDSGMLQAAQKKFGASATILNYDLDDSIKLPIESSSQEIVTAISVLYSLQKPKWFLQEIRRVLTPSGRLILVTPIDGYENGFILRDHSDLVKPDSFWRNMHTSRERERAVITAVFGDDPIVEDLLYIAECNAKILASGTHKFTFYTKSALLRLLDEAEFTVLGPLDFDVLRSGFERDHQLAVVHSGGNVLIIEPNGRDFRGGR